MHYRDRMVLYVPSGGWGQLLIGVWFTVRVVVQYALRCATNLSGEIVDGPSTWLQSCGPWYWASLVFNGLCQSYLLGKVSL